MAVSKQGEIDISAQTEMPVSEVDETKKENYEDEEIKNVEEEQDEEKLDVSKNLHKAAEKLMTRMQHHENKTDNLDRYIPGPLPARGHDISDIVDLLSGLIGYDDNGHGCNVTSPMVPLDDVNNAAVVSHSLSAYLRSLYRPHLHKLVTRIVSDTTLWVSRLFRFFDTSACFHDEQHEGLVRLCRALLRMRYPKYEEDGYESLYSRPPVVYLSPVTGTNLGQLLCNKLGLPRSSVCVIPGPKISGQQSRMDLVALERAIQEDLAAQRIPLLVVANAGASIIGHVDNLQKLQDICKSQELWLHVEGHSLAGLCLVPAPTLPARVGDSVTLPLGQWLGVYGIPNITLYKTLDPRVSLASGLASPTAQQKLICLPLWVTLQTMGHDGVINRIHHAFQLSRHFQDRLSELPAIKILGKQTAEDKQANIASVSELTSKAVSTAVLFDVLSPTVAFRFIGQDKALQLIDYGGMQQSPHSVLNPAYFNSLNNWLGQILQRDISKVHLDIAELENNTICLRYCPLEGLRNQNSEMSIEMLDSFVNCLFRQVDILNATVTHKKVFPTLIAKHPNLDLVELSEWAGLGGVKYIPDIWKDNLNELPDSGKEDVNRVNEQLVAQLKATDSAFSLGEGEDGVYCVRFGMVTEDTDMEELLELVVRGGRAIEESSKNMEEMKEMIKKGIETANEDLKKENDERIWQEGILRQVPVVSSLFNWWAPLPKETGVKGRSFNLSSGVIESTENIYKYHMQLQEGPPKAGGPNTPKPVVQTPIIVSSDHTRTPSRGSTGTPRGPSPALSDQQQSLIAENTNYRETQSPPAT